MSSRLIPATPGVYEDEQKTPEAVYNEFWKELVEKDGVVDMTQVKKELCDFKYMIDQVPLIYEHVTGGTLSKPMYSAKTVIAQADDHSQQVYEDLIEDEIDCHIGQKISLGDVLTELGGWRAMGARLAAVSVSEDADLGAGYRNGSILSRYREEAEKLIGKDKSEVEAVNE